MIITFYGCGDSGVSVLDNPDASVLLTGATSAMKNYY